MFFVLQPSIILIGIQLKMRQIHYINKIYPNIFIINRLDNEKVLNGVGQSWNRGLPGTGIFFGPDAVKTEGLLEIFRWLYTLGKE